MYARFNRENSWIKKYIPNIRQIIPNDSRIVTKPRWFFPSIITEKFAKKIQEKKFPRNITALAEDINTHVIISDTMLKFHVNDRRHFYQKVFMHKIRS